VTVIDALGLADPNPVLRSAWVVAAERDRLAIRTNDPYYAGGRVTLSWLLGQAQVCPGSGWRWTHGTPTGKQAVAEYHLVTGRVYREGTTAVSGVDSALSWALQYDDHGLPSS
jgi:hypothetical protein